MGERVELEYDEPSIADVLRYRLILLELLSRRVEHVRAISERPSVEAD